MCTPCDTPADCGRSLHESKDLGALKFCLSETLKFEILAWRVGELPELLGHFGLL